MLVLLRNAASEVLMSPVSNSERQKRFRELTSKERQVKAAAFDWLITAIESGQSPTIPLTDGRNLQVHSSNGVVRVQIIADPKAQNDIARARYRLLHGE
jgi:hypothetical protein